MQRGQDSSSSDYVRVVSRMLYNEPVVAAAVQTLQSNCLRHGVHLRWGNTPATPSFQRHIRQYYEPFCREAIVAFVAVGFAPFRLRREGPHMVPEILPLGTYSWSVMHNPQPRKRQRGNGYAPHPSNPAPEMEFQAQPPPNRTPPLLRYNVICTHCDDTIHVVPFVPPQAALSCYSALSSLVTQYLSLLTLRERAAGAEEWNCQPRIGFEERDQVPINELAHTGGGVNMPHTAIFSGMEHFSRAARQEASMEIAEQTKDQAALPKSSTILPAPRNNSIRPLDKVDAPPDIMKRELYFARSVMLALGIPASLAMSGTSALSSSSGGGSGWHESPEVFSRSLNETCLRINRALEDLMTVAYSAVYGALSDDTPRTTAADASARRLPTFLIPAAPTLPVAQLLPLFDAQLIDDEAYSHLVEVTLGFPMNRKAATDARTERNRALNVLPFKDKKDAPK